MGMFCYQCEQTARGTGCDYLGICGKDPKTAALQDLLLHAVKGISRYACRLRKAGIENSDIDDFVIDALFTTVTNVNFDPARLATQIQHAYKVKKDAETLYLEKAGSDAALESKGTQSWVPAEDLEGLIRQGSAVSILERVSTDGPDVTGLEELLTYGIKGMAAYLHHAQILGYRRPEAAAFIYEAFEYMSAGDRDIQTLLGLNLRCGEVNLGVLELLDGAHTASFGVPTPAEVRVTPVKGKAILVSGHDLKDLEVLLQQTEGKGINIYTHGEMLPAHGYPNLKKYPHLAGNYGGAWQDQAAEFAAFPGAILMTTNCIQAPRSSYIHRIFTCGLVAWPGVRHIENRDFNPVIEAALAEEGFSSDAPEKKITVGFGHGSVLGVADAVIAAVNQKQIRHFYVIGGCDGAKPGRNYFTDFACNVPKDCVVLTLGCGKYRFNKEDFGTIGGIPRLLDLGQCNDAYSAIKIAGSLAGALGCGVNDLPLSLVISWYEQKAVCVLLSLLHLGIRNIRLGPTLPAFLTESVRRVLNEQFGLRQTGAAAEDIEATLAA